MSFTADDELVIREATCDKLAAAGVTYPLPSPLYFADKADFFAIVDTNSAIVDPQVTQKAIETTSARFCTMTFLKFVDDIVAGCDDQPLLRLTYGYYLFTEYDFERLDETVTPDDFEKKVLRAERDFLTDVFSMRAEFTGLQPIDDPDLPANYAVTSNPLIQQDFAVQKGNCRYIPGVTGFSMDLQNIIEVIISE